MPARGERLLALDVFRGATVAGMLLVNDPGSWSHIFPPLEHATWNGCTPTDLVFPFFLFVVGITTELSRAARRARGADDSALVKQILRRGSLIVLCGLLLSWFPFYTWGDVPVGASRFVDRLYHVRIPGILQRIGVVYLVAALLTLRTSTRTQIAIIAGILVGYWALTVSFPMRPPEVTLAARVDRLLLDWGPYGNHLWSGTVTWDPEGFVSTIPAVATAMLGVLAGKWLVPGRLVAWGTVGILVGLLWNYVFPINKNLWTSSFVVFTAGVAAVTLALCIWIIDVRGVRWWTPPFVVFGVNPLVAFIGSEAMARLIYSVLTVHSVSLATLGYNLFTPWLSPRMASLAFAVGFVLFWLGVLTVLYRRNIIVKL